MERGHKRDCPIVAGSAGGETDTRVSGRDLDALSRNEPRPCLNFVIDRFVLNLTGSLFCTCYTSSHYLPLKMQFQAIQRFDAKTQPLMDSQASDTKMPALPPIEPNAKRQKLGDDVANGTMVASPPPVLQTGGMAEGGHLVHSQLITAGAAAPIPASMSALGGNHNQIKAFLDHISLGQYWRLLSENGCDTLEDLATADVQMLVNLGFKIFHANRLVTAVHRFIRPAPPVINQPTKRKRASHVRTFAEMYQRVEEFQNLVNQVGSMSAAERDPRSSISRGAYTQYLRIKELAEKEQISLTDEKYVNVKPTEKNVKEIIAKEKTSKMEPTHGVPLPSVISNNPVSVPGGEHAEELS
eukprot:jgi/Bigna1/76948/fgenesh1_pg.44_\